MIAFLRKHPKLLAFTITLLTAVNKRCLAFLNASMLFLIHLKGLNPNPPPPAPPPEPKVDDVFNKFPPSTRNKIYVGMPYVPAWVVRSFKNKEAHIINQNRAARAPLRTKEDPIEPVDSAKAEAALNTLSQAINKLKDS